jgi:hypothetical protein
MELQLELVPISDKNFKVVGHDKIYEALDNMISGINMVLANRYVTIIRQGADELKKTLVRFNEIFEEMVELQKTWTYMEKIFGQAEIKSMLPQETAIFQGITKFWEQTMNSFKMPVNKVVAK